MSVQKTAIIHSTELPVDLVRINYSDNPPRHGSEPKGVILLIHGFPQTSHQFRHVIGPLASAGYRVIVPDYRGAGHSSKPHSGFTKTVMASDLRDVIRNHLGITEKIHVVGHDIGGMIAPAYALQYQDEVASLCWGECPLPGTTFYDETKGSPMLFHFNFHGTPDLPEKLVEGKEQIYIKHFYDKLAYNTSAITQADVEHYTMMYSLPGAMRCGFNTYRTFEHDKKENLELIKKNGKLKVKTLTLFGDHGFMKHGAQGMSEELSDNQRVEFVKEANHWVAEENPGDFVERILRFVSQ